MVLCVCIVVCVLAAQPVGRPGTSTVFVLFLWQRHLKKTIMTPTVNGAVAVDAPPTRLVQLCVENLQQVPRALLRTR